MSSLVEINSWSVSMRIVRARKSRNFSFKFRGFYTREEYRISFLRTMIRIKVTIPEGWDHLDIRRLRTFLKPAEVEIVK